MRGARDRLTDNAFFVLGVAPSATPREIEREAQKLLGMLELGLAAATTYATPLGPRPRTAERVRAAAATLRDPRQRLIAELGAAAGTTPAAAPSPAAAPPPALAWPTALSDAGWTRAPRDEGGREDGPR